MKRLFALSLALVMVLALFAGCAPKTPVDEKVVKDTLVIAQNADIYSMDPQLKKDTPSGRIKTLVFETLVNVNEKNEIVPGLAKSWKIVDDTTIQFTLQDNVTFHNGDKLTIDDIIFTFLRGSTAPQTSATMAPIDVEKSKAISDNVFEMKLKAPYGAILLNLTDNCCSIVNKKYITAVGDKEFALAPIGTGPYSFTKWTSGDRSEVTRYDAYWGKKPHFKNITFRVMTEAANRAIELETGGVDVALDILPGDVSRIESNEKLSLQRGPNYSVTYMAMNGSKKPFDDVRVRQAVTYALDLPAIVDAVYMGTGAVGTGPLAKPVWGYDDSIKASVQNIEKSKELLAAAGYANGLTTSILTSDHQQRMDFSEIACNQLAAVGITCKINIMEWGAYLDAVFAGQHEMTVLGYSYGLDPGVGLYNVFSSKCFGEDGNISWYKNDRVDEILATAQGEMNEAKRLSMYKEAQKIISEEAPWVFIWQGENIDGINKNLKGFVNRADSMYRFMDMYYE